MSGLDEAWAEAEAALPEGWSFRGLTPIGPSLWHALALGGHSDHLCSDGINHREYEKASATGPTPVAALEALVAKLRENGAAAPAEAREDRDAAERRKAASR